MNQIDLPRRHHLDAITSERWTASDQNRWTPSVRYARTASLESAIGGGQRGSPEQVRPADADAEISGARGAVGQPESGRSVPIIVAALVPEWRIRAHKYR